MLNYERAKKLVESGKSEIYSNWNEATGITVEDFLEGIEWLCGDPMVTFPNWTTPKPYREIACEKDGSITKLFRAYDKEGSFIGFYRISDGRLHYGSKAMLNIKDSI